MTKSINASDVNLIIMACEAGMGSSLMVVNSIKKKLKKAKVQGVKVIHKPARNVPETAKVVVVHEGLSKVVRRKAPDAVIVKFKHFLNDPAFDRLVNSFVEGGDIVNTVEA
ncbi:MAG: PTS lactose transporter subunit IIB [Chloroflexota bacterium]